MERNRNNGAEFRAPQQTRERFSHPPVVLQGGRDLVPYARRNETIPVRIVSFKDHGRAAFIGSTIGGNPALMEVARSLGEDEGKRINDALIRVMESFLDDGSVRSDGVMKSSEGERPDIHILNVGNSFQDSGLRLYFHIREYNGAPVVIQDARTTVRNAEKVDRVLKRDGSYLPPKGWENSKRNSGRN